MPTGSRMFTVRAVGNRALKLAAKKPAYLKIPSINRSPPMPVASTANRSLGRSFFAISNSPMR
jgi:hypothetical protein